MAALSVFHCLFFYGLQQPSSPVASACLLPNPKLLNFQPVPAGKSVGATETIPVFVAQSDGLSAWAHVLACAFAGAMAIAGR
jgi:hypothetical protein